MSACVSFAGFSYHEEGVQAWEHFRKREPENCSRERRIDRWVDVLNLVRIGGQIIELMLVSAPDGIVEIIGLSYDSQGFICVVEPVRYCVLEVSL